MKVIFILCTLFILCFLILINTNNQSVELTSQSITHDSEEVDCHWLDKEYDRIVSWNNKNEREVTVTPEGLVMTVLTVVTLPIRWIDDFLSEDIEYHFSDNPDDVVAAAEKKECYNLLEKINQDRINGTYPLLPESNQK